MTDDAPDEPAARSGSVRPVRWGVAGVGVGLVVVLALVLTGTLARDRSVSGDEALDQLVEAWRRHRSGTFVVESEWRRTRTDGNGTLVSATLLVQRPPDRIHRQLGAVRGQLNGQVIRCSTDPVSGYRCFPSDAPAPDFTEDLDAEMDALRSYGSGPRPLYAVSTDGSGCFELDLLVAYPDPPYGRRARLCFDDETGALRSLWRDVGTVVEEQEAITIRTDVVDADFDLSVDPDYDPTGDLPAPDLDALLAPPATEGGAVDPPDVPPTTR